MKKYKISFVFNIIIVLMVVFASFAMFTGFKFMHGMEPVLESTKLGMFRFFTVDSNMFMGIVSLLFIIFEYRLFKNKISIPKWLYILKLMATCGVALTFLVVFLYLGPIFEGGIKGLLMNSNLFFHFLIPVFSIITFIFFEKNNLLFFKDSFYGMAPCLVYSVYYIINVLIHVENGKVSPEYDWYWFVQNGIWTAFIVVPVILLFTYLISLFLWRFNIDKSN